MNSRAGERHREKGKEAEEAEQEEKEMPFELELIRQLNHVDPAREDGGNVHAGISCILAMPQVVYTGDEDGRVVSFPLFFFSSSLHPDSLLFALFFASRFLLLLD